MDGDIQLNALVFLAVWYLTFTNVLCQFWNYWTEFHEIFTRYRSIFMPLIHTLR